MIKNKRILTATQYDGLEIDRLAVLMEAPEYAGVYKLNYSLAGVYQASTELFVQDTLISVTLYRSSTRAKIWLSSRNRPL